MKFIDSEHETFYNEKIIQVPYQDSYNRSLIYLLSMNQETRKHFNEIYNIETNEINIKSLKGAWQTGTSINICRLAFNLFNGCANDNQRYNSMSKDYSISNLFCTSGSFYFFEAIKLRYPEYTKEKQIRNDITTVIYTRVGNIEQLEEYVKEEIEDQYCKDIAGLYIRTGEQSADNVNSDIYEQIKRLEEYCKTNDILNRIQYIDIRKSGIADDRKALKEMTKDIESGKINKIIVVSPNKLFRDMSKMLDFIGYSKYKNVEIIALDLGIIKTDVLLASLDDVKNKVVENYEENELEDVIKY